MDALFKSILDNLEAALRGGVHEEVKFCCDRQCHHVTDSLPPQRPLRRKPHFIHPAQTESLDLRNDESGGGCEALDGGYSQRRKKR
ncbi:hypothetical protein QR680_011635 [Steinernema hermaphroditum]|uniref:Uncharacterized protein n=1 Tax=Steinernema hermaphroditum TaxID=289476 RepID=A0AA39LZ18_9BILA|nr:hypothetical protein QR680_011635 [Steinernema hermaphroditum]